jgi:serine/threonine protein kinase
VVVAEGVETDADAPGGARTSHGLPSPKRRVGHYEIIRQVGRGGMATVYLARQVALDRNVALKELSSFHASSPEFAERFLRESRLAGSLNHPNIVTVLEYFEEGGTPYIAMEYVRGGSLRPYVGRLGMAQFAGVMEGVLAGLTHAETIGVVHRDLKPENLMVTSDGRVKIADFGIAKATQSAGTAAFLTATGTTVGTPTYMAPEQAMAGDVGMWTDLYSVGVMAWEHIVGHVPFHDTEAPMVILMRQVNEQIPPASQVNPDVDPDLSDWIDRLLIKDPSQRTRSAIGAWEQLEEIVIGVLGPRWRRDARLPEHVSTLDTPRALTPAPFSIKSPTPPPSSIAKAQAPPSAPAAAPEPAPAPTPEPEPEYLTFGAPAPSAEAAVAPAASAAAPLSDVPAPEAAPESAPSPAADAPASAAPPPTAPPTPASGAPRAPEPAVPASDSPYVTYGATFPEAPAPIAEASVSEAAASVSQAAASPPEAPTESAAADPNPGPDAAYVTVASSGAPPVAPEPVAPEPAADDIAPAVRTAGASAIVAPVSETLAPERIVPREAEPATAEPEPAEPALAPAAREVIPEPVAPEPSVALPSPAAETQAPTQADRPAAPAQHRRQAQAAPRSRTAGVRRAAVLALVVAIVAAVLGFVLAPSKKTPSQAAGPPLIGSAASGPLTISFPAGWAHAPSGAVAHLPLTDELTVSAAAPAGGTLVMGTASSSGASLLPASFVSALSSPPSPQIVTLGKAQFYRYLDVTPAGSAGPETVYALPTSVGSVVAVCRASSGSATFPSACERVVGTLQVAGTVLALGPNPAYASGLSAAMAKLTAARNGAEAQLSSAKSPSRQASAAHSAAGAYGQAAAAVQKLTPGPQAQSANSAIAGALQKLAGGYTALARAASHHDGHGYAGARSQITAATGELSAAFGQLTKLGYTIG